MITALQSSINDPTMVIVNHEGGSQSTTPQSFSVTSDNSRGRFYHDPNDGCVYGPTFGPSGSDDCHEAEGEAIKSDPSKGSRCKSSFNLEKTVCNHGFFMMAPNKWISSTKSLQRPLRLADQCSSVIVTISHLPESANIQIYVHDMEGVSLKSEQAILKQVARMLRISDKDEKAVNEFQGLYPQAKQDEFGRIFRSPSLFEDVVKSILLCKCTWGKTLNMVKSLCELQLQLSSGPRSNRKKQCKTKRKRGQNNATSKKNHGIGNFPNSKELVKFGETILRERCKVGYRAQFIIKLAQSVEKGTLVLEKLEMECNLWSYKVVHRKLSELKGFGPFVVATILMCMGCYEKVPVDSETKRHLNQV
ncbi:hypothetical protein JHK84_035452 [Glycine max]|nr:hypothetical protein JHK85_035775 [Glycine max]KAG4975667.1 hypothetical protein JHK86_035141 [Glycine max]KAG5129055.1 hypothetical protein JHK84_035452 [Glycine max]